MSDKVERMKEWMDKFNEIIDFDLYLGGFEKNESFLICLCSMS